MKKKTRMNIFYCVIGPKHSIKIKTLVIGKKFRFEIIFQNGELGHFTKRRINRIRTKTFVITNSMKGNILWVDIYRSTYFFERMLSTSCSFFNILFYCQKSTPQKLFLALQTHEQELCEYS